MLLYLKSCMSTKELHCSLSQVFRKRFPVHPGVRYDFVSGYPVSLKGHTLNNISASVEATRMQYFFKLLTSGFMCALKENTVDLYFMLQ